MTDSAPSRTLLSSLGLDASQVVALSRLPGEVDANWRVDTAPGTTYLLKITCNDQFDQRPILHHLAQVELPFAVPRVLRSVAQSSLATFRTAHLHTWLPGRLLAEVHPRTPELWDSWGDSCGRLQTALRDLTYPAADRLYKWDPARAGHARDRIPYLAPTDRPLVAGCLDRLEALPLGDLPRSICYNDAHEHNLLVGADHRITGVIDFGDAVRTVSVSELAVACAYAAMDLPDPLGALAIVVRAYHRVAPLTEAEIAALYDLIAARLCLTLLFAAENRHLQPENAYLSVSETSARNLLRIWTSMPPGLPLATFRHACGYPVHASAGAFHAWARTLDPHPVLDLTGGVFPMDLGVGSTQLGGIATFTDPDRFSTHIRRLLEDAGAAIGSGGYGEVRPVYTTDDFMSEGNSGPRWRSVHLGLDLWTRSPGAEVYAPLSGRVFATGTDPTAGGYGGTVILAHEPVPGLTFYTLYGHLAPDSLIAAGAGAQVRGGQPIGRLGGRENNGGWPPHLHFQILLDPLGMGVDYPGVAYPDAKEIWLGLCPDPRHLLPPLIPAEMPAPADPTRLLEERRRSLGYSLSVSYAKPLQILRGFGPYLYDETGRRYLDTVNNVAHVGHEHPAIVAAGQRQLAVLNTNTRYLHPAVLAFADELRKTLPPELCVVHFVNSGSEANELALRMAETVTGTRNTVALAMGYHGNTTRTVEVSEYKFGRRGGGGRPHGTHLLPVPEPAESYPLDIPDGPWSFIGETILSCAGQLPLPAGFLAAVYRRIRAAGGICIADEVQTGVGRTGNHWWAFQAQDVVPDVVTIGKPIGNGHPLGAVVCTEEVASAFANGMEYFNTFGGNPVSSAIGSAVLRAVRDEGLMQHALATGGYLIRQLDQLAAEHSLIGERRGSGLFLGVELLGENGHPATLPAKYVKNRMRELGVLTSTDGPYDNVLKIKPPMCFDGNHADRFCSTLDRVLRENGARIA